MNLDTLKVLVKSFDDDHGQQGPTYDTVTGIVRRLMGQKSAEVFVNTIQACENHFYIPVTTTSGDDIGEQLWDAMMRVQNKLITLHAYHIGQKVRHKENGVEGIVVGLTTLWAIVDGDCDNVAEHQPWYQVRIDPDCKSIKEMNITNPDGSLSGEFVFVGEVPTMMQEAEDSLEKV